MRRFPVLLVVVGLFIACGARTSIDESPSAANQDASLSDAQVDGARDSGDSGLDAFPPPDAPACSGDEDCNDDIPCTRDSCHPTARRCVNIADDKLCDNGLFCDGDERCDVTAKKCVAGVRNCEEGIACTVDTCNELTRACEHRPEDARCPISHGCDPVDGCQARALAHDQTTLYEVRLPSGKLRTIGPIGVRLTDIALHPNNTLYAISSNTFYTLNTNTGAATQVGPLLSTQWTSMDAAPDGTLYGGAGNAVYVLSLTGTAVVFATYPSGFSSSGDIAFVGGRLLGTVQNGGATDSLAEIDMTTKKSRILGNIGFNCVWGLAAYGPTLYGLTCEGYVLQIDSNTGAGTSVNKSSTAFWGASAR